MQYINHMVDKYQLRDKALFNTRITHAEWQEKDAVWQVDIEHENGSGERLTPNIVLSCSGLFSTPKLPNIEGIDTYQGKMFHTTDWDHDYDYAGKRVALIGTGSTGSQLMPRVAEQAATMSVYQRTPNWVTPVGRYRAPIPDKRKWLLKNMPGYSNWNRYSFVQASVRNQAFQYLDRDWQDKGGRINEKNDQLREALTAMIHAKMADRPEYIEHLIPDFAPLSRRIVVDNGWYDALLRENVELVTDPILRVTPTGIVTQHGIEREFDLIILAAGFEVERYLWPVQYVGRGGGT
ncbi:MAG: NAD(P)/FAD-dependent oxidoreductase, partial [Proteobacteria bacterium]|nr:NAD(P)/FAD-dependent oxidoreductase [Pseudomonadota bacterium]